MKSSPITAPPQEPTIEELAALDLSPPDTESVVKHPDGWYWLNTDVHQEFGPYATAEDALAALHAAEEDELEPGETLEEAEQERGIADWLDPETGEPAEGTHTHIEDR
jgi:hypothetical protein